MNNKLYILATPIGNLQEVNNLLIDKLESLPILFCEDTRTTSDLLHHLKIKNKPKLISYHKFNEQQKKEECYKYLTKNDCGLISDAGYPTISDPGFSLVQYCHQKQIKVCVVNGSCAINHAIAQSGFCSNGFIFIGFLPRNKKEIIESINTNLTLNLPIVYFESVHRINNTIAILKQNFAKHEIYIGRELTKKFESYQIAQAANLTQEKEKGEFCIIINPIKEQANKKLSLNSFKINEAINELVAINVKPKEACKIVAMLTNSNASELYNAYLSLKKK